MFAFKPCGDKSLQRLDIGLRNDLYTLKTEAASDLKPGGSGFKSRSDQLAGVVGVVV